MRRVSDDEVTAIAVRVRDAFERGRPWRLPGLAKFPTASCGDTSRLTAEYLRRAGYGDWKLVSGDNGNYEASRTHAWLISDGLILDLTSDQFADGPGRVVVTRDSSWYSQQWPGQRIYADRVGLNYYAVDSGANQDFDRLCALLA